MNRYRFGHHDYCPSDEAWQHVLEKAYASKLHPLCLCKPNDKRPSLYISRLATQYILKRMPDTGGDHAPHCDHYEPPPQLSGLGQVLGVAIREDSATQITTLALDFSLSKGKARRMADTPDVKHDSVKNDGTKLTLRGLFDYLYDQAGLTRWSPAMMGKRNWFVVRRELLNALASKQTKGMALADLIYIPETFSAARVDDINRHRTQRLARLNSSPNARMIFIAQFKGFDDARFGTAMKLVGDSTRLFMNDKLTAKLKAHFQHQLQLSDQFKLTHLLVIAAVSRSSHGVFLVENASLVNVSAEWIPFESAFEWELLSELLLHERRYVKGLRYNLPATKPLASVVLQDTGEIPAALFVVPADSATDYAAAASALAADGKTRAWVWETTVPEIPALPEKISFARHAA
jgi:Protein of unknown function (DUF1173)